MANRIELRAVCSTQVRNQANNNVPESGVVAWPVDVTRPFGDEANLGRFARQLNLSVPLELTHYHEGTPGDVIDLQRTPSELAYRARMSVYVRVKRVQRRESALLPPDIDLKLSEEEERLIRRLRNHLQPALRPQDPCPVCARTEMTEEERASAEQLGYSGGGLAGSPSGGAGLVTSMSGGAFGQSQSFMTQPVSDLQIGLRSKANAAVQVGNAGRMNEGVMPVSFGAASRLREAPIGKPATGGSAAAGAFSGAFEFDDATSDLKRQVEEAARERDILRRQLEDTRLAKEALEREKRNHRCEVSVEVRKLRDDNVMLHGALRDLMRGREEVFSRLHERRTVGSMLSDTPRPYSPLAARAPVDDGSPRVKVSQLLATAEYDETRRDEPADATPGGREVETAPSYTLLKRPSGVAATDVGIVSPHRAQDADASKQTANHVPGQCLLRIGSVTGDPFYVKRKITSQIRDGGQHVFTLLSLDGIVTDEIHVSELELCAAEGPSGLLLSTAKNSWAMYMAPSERAQWLHWFYALNPFLSAEHRGQAGVPNSY